MTINAQYCFLIFFKIFLYIYRCFVLICRIIATKNCEIAKQTGTENR